MPYDFFMSRYKEAYVQETLAFVECLVKDEPAPCSGEDGLIALLMSIAAGKSAQERRWVKFSELAPDLCALSSDLGNLTAEECIVDLTLDDGALDLQNLGSKVEGLIRPTKLESVKSYLSKIFQPK